MENNEPEHTARMVVDSCSDCDVCRFLMDSDCLMFPELYRLYDNEIETGKKITSKELRKLVDLCNFCALCPCPNIRADIIKAKTQFIDRDGLKFGVRTLEDVERIGKLCGMFPQLTNLLFQNKLTGELFKSATGIHQERQFELIKKSMYAKILKDQGYFSTIAPLKRIKVAENTFDVGEYLMGLHRAAELKANFGEVSGHMVYYPPCHLREQSIDRPYQDLLNLLPGINLDPVNGSLYCCGMAGIMGFKHDFHETSIHLGSRLMDKIKGLDPQWLITDCLSCRLQFNQLLPYKVYHPIEILKDAYKGIKLQ